MVILYGCNSENECEYYLLEQELNIEENYNSDLLFCIAYRDFLTDGKPKDMFVLKIDKSSVNDYLRENTNYKKYTKNKYQEVFNPYSLINDLYNEVHSSKKVEEYRGIISKITPKNSFYLNLEKENYYVESLIDKNGYIILSIEMY